MRFLFLIENKQSRKHVYLLKIQNFKWQPFYKFSQSYIDTCNFIYRDRKIAGRDRFQELDIPS